MSDRGSEMKQTRSQQFSTGSLAAALVLSMTALPAFADQIFYGVDFGVWDKPVQDVKDLGLTEESIFIVQNATVGQNAPLFGSLDKNTANQDVYWTSADPTGLEGTGNGGGTIKGGKPEGSNQNALIHDITFGVMNAYFEDVIFAVMQTGGYSFKLTALFDDGTTEETFITPPNTGDTAYLVYADGEKLFKEINISSAYGIEGLEGGYEYVDDEGVTQTKQWAVSGITPVPLPAAAWLFGSALLGMAGIGYRRSRDA